MTRNRPAWTPIGRRAALAGLATLSSVRIVAAQTGPGPLLPPLLARRSDARFPGKLIFAQLTTPDLAAAQDFYGRLFGWEFDSYQLGQVAYAVVSVEGHRIGGMLERAEPASGPREPIWLPFFSAADPTTASGLARAAGGRVLVDATAVPRLGREAILADPSGAAFAVLASASGDPPDRVPPVAAWIWAALITADPVAAAAFYQRVFGVDVFDMTTPGAARHLLLASDNIARSSVNAVPGRAADAHACWISFLRTDDSAAIAARAAALGGRVLVTPRADRAGGRLAVLADRQGAVFGVFEWASGGRSP